jgi:hypothetical protein
MHLGRLHLAEGSPVGEITWPTGSLYTHTIGRDSQIRNKSLAMLQHL